MIHTFFSTLWTLTNEMSPYLLLGFFMAGLLYVFLPRKIYSKHLSKRSFGSVLKAAAFGIPFPLCSCGVIPTAMSLRKEGASKGATVSFLTSTPQTGVDSIAATYSLMGLPFAIIRPIAALFTALASGFMVNKLDKKNATNIEIEQSKNHCDCENCDTQNNKKSEKENIATHCDCGSCETKTTDRPTTWGAKWKTVLRYGFYDMVQDIGKWLIIGLVVAAIITMVIPDDFFASLSTYPILSMLLVLLLSVPMYLCATGSIPIALALMLKGLSPGAALVLLMAGPATNATALIVIYKVLGKKATFIYLAVLIVGAMIFGLGIDYLLPHDWFAVTTKIAEACHTNQWMHWTGIGSTVIMAALILNAFIGKYRIKKEIEIENKSRKFHVQGMMCNHCKNNVEKNVAGLSGVTHSHVDLQSGIVIVEGDVDNNLVIQCVQALGYRCEETT